MLHAGYARLSGRERDRVDDLLNQQMEQINDSRIEELVELYRNDDPSSLENEMHSIFGTEVAELIPELEEYYSQYFDDRAQIVAISKSYEQVFVDINKKIEALEKDISALKNQIAQLETSIGASQAKIDAESARLDALRDSGDIPGI